MIEPGIEDVGKEVVVNYSYLSQQKGYITSINPDFVQVRVEGADQPRSFKRKFLRWAPGQFGANKMVNVF